MTLENFPWDLAIWGIVCYFIGLAMGWFLSRYSNKENRSYKR